MSKPARRSRLHAGWLVPALLFPLLAAPALRAQPASQPAADLLANDRWVAQGLGISLRPPLGATLLKQTVANFLLKILCTNGCNIVVAIRDFDGDLNIDQVQAGAIKQMTDARPSREIVDRKPLTLGGRGGAIITFKIPDFNTGPLVISEAMILLTPRKALVVTAEVDARLYQAAKPLWDQLLASIRIDDPATLAKERRQMIEDGAAWSSAIDAKRIAVAIVPEQWFRIVSGNDDVGYIYIHQAPVKAKDKANQLHLDGSNVFVQTCAVVAGDTMLSDGDYYQSSDNQHELWIIRTVIRKSKPPPPGAKHDPTMPAPGTGWVEIGARDGNHLNVDEGSPTVPRKTMGFDLPPSTYTRPGDPEPVSAYISTVEQQLIGRLLTPRETKTLGFYSFNSGAGKLEFRTERVEVNKDGSYRVLSRLAPGQDEQAAEFDPAGALVRIVLPSGNVLLPVTQDRLIAIWRVKELSDR